MIENEEQRAFRDVCQRFAEQEIAPLVDEAEATGVSPRNLRRKAGDAGLLGLTASQAIGGGGAKLWHQCIIIEECAVSEDAPLGEEGHGMDCIMSVPEEDRNTHAARSLGVASAGNDAAVEDAGQRRTFGNTIIQYQAIQMKLTQMLIDITSARPHVYSAAQRFDSGEPSQVEASRAKVVASETVVSVTDQAMRIFVGAGYINDAPVQRSFRDARLYPIAEGTTEIQRRTIARVARLI